MARQATKSYPAPVLELMAEKTTVLTKAQAFAEMGMPETALPLWGSAASYEEQIAPLLEALGHDREAAVHRISAASCYQKAGNLARAANLYRAALAGPLDHQTQQDVQQMLSECLTELSRAALGRAARRRPGGVTTEA